MVGMRPCKLPNILQNHLTTVEKAWEAALHFEEPRKGMIAAYGDDLLAKQNKRNQKKPCKKKG